MWRQLVAAGAAIGIAESTLTAVAERVIRPRVYYTGEAWHPEPPDAVRWPYEEARFYTADGIELQGWLFKATRPAPTILFCHGTSYSASDMWVSPERASSFHEFMSGIGCNFFIFDYRGYGQNGGSPTEERTYLDAAAALGWLYEREDVDPSTIFFYGFSLGSGIATELAMREPSAGLILRAPFTSIRDVIVGRYPKLRPLLAAAPWLPLTNYNNFAKIHRLDRPLLVMHGDADETVPERMGQQIFEAAPVEHKMYVQFPNSGHSDIATDLVVPAIRQFVDETLAHQARPATAERA